MAKLLQDGSPRMSQSMRTSKTPSDVTIYLDGTVARLSTASSLASKQRHSYVQRVSSHGTDISLTITEPRDSIYRSSYALHLGPRLSAPPTTPEPKILAQKHSLGGSTIRPKYQRSTLSNELRAIQYDEQQDSAIKHTSRLWSPWSLRVSALLAIIIFLLLCIVGLEVLSLLSKRENGIRKWGETARFLWLYVPPFIFFIFASIWRQVEYRTKQLMPWRTMASAPASASHSILLNYVTPLNVISFVQSIASGHPGVAVSIAAGFFNKLLIITATAVLSLQDGHLILQTTPLRVMESLLGSIILLVAAMIVLRPAPATPNDTSTIAGLSAVLSNSAGYASVMRGLALAQPEKLEEEVYKHRYQTNVGHKGKEPFFRLSLASKEEAVLGSLLNDSPNASAPDKWWSPIHDLTRLSILAFILGNIVAVELLHQRSQSGRGLINIKDSSPIRYAWQILPATVSVVIFILVGMIDQATRLIQPFQTLKRGNARASSSIGVNYLAHMAPTALLKALRHRHWGVAVSVTAVLIAPLLTIASAGMFFPLNGRLVQDKMSTRVLEGLLGTLFFLLAVSSLLTDTRRVLPYNPYSIARMSTLIAESSLIEGLVPSGTEWASEKAIKDSNTFSKLNFSLGYFEKPRDQRKTESIFGIDVGDAQAVA